MRFVWLTMKKDLLLKSRDPVAVLIWFGTPLLVAALMTMVFGGGSAPLHGRILVADQDDTFASRSVQQSFHQGPMEDIFDVEGVDVEEGEAMMDAGEASVMIVVPEGFQEDLLDGEPATIRVIRNPSQRYLPDMAEETLEILAQVVFYAQHAAGDELRTIRAQLDGEGLTMDQLNELIDGAQVLLSTVDDGALLDRIQLEAVEDDPDEEDGPFNFGLMFFPGMLFMALLFTAQGMSEDIWREKEDGTLRRIAASPRPIIGFLAGKALAFLALAAAVVSATLLVGVWSFGAPLEAVPAGLIWALGAGLTFFLLFTLIVIHASSRRTATVLASMLLFPLLMVGGSFFPFEQMPSFMASIGRMTPNGWALSGFKAIIDQEFSAQQFVTGLGLMALGSAALFAVASRRVRAAFLGS